MRTAVHMAQSGRGARHVCPERALIAFTYTASFLFFALASRSPPRLYTASLLITRVYALAHAPQPRSPARFAIPAPPRRPAPRRDIRAAAAAAAARASIERHAVRGGRDISRREADTGTISKNSAPLPHSRGIVLYNTPFS
eukprot:IDg14529t1